MSKTLETELADAVTAYAMACSNLAHLGNKVLRSGKTYKELTDIAIGAVVRHIVISSHSKSEVHNRLIKELKIESFSIQPLCSPNHTRSQKKCLATGVLATKDGTMLVITINSPNGTKGDTIVI